MSGTAADSTPVYDVSVVTAAFNSMATIRDTIASVHAATGVKLQHVIVDGGSKDGSAELARSLARPGDVVISEPDKGISDAFNKGIALSTGRYVHFLNSDDWADPDFWTVLVRAADGRDDPILHSDLNIHRPHDVISRKSGRADYDCAGLFSMAGISHPSMLVRRDVYQRVGLFDLRYKSAMDLDWLIRAQKLGYRSRYVPGAVVHFRASHGASFSYRAVFESREIAARHGLHKGVRDFRSLAKWARITVHANAEHLPRWLYRWIARAD